jgi:hypothetical protein
MRKTKKGDPKSETTVFRAANLSNGRIVDRRDMFRLCAGGVSTVLVPWLLSSCGSGDDETRETRVPATVKVVEAGVLCADPDWICAGGYQRKSTVFVGDLLTVDDWKTVDSKVYFKVRTASGADGWIWELNVEIVSWKSFKQSCESAAPPVHKCSCDCVSVPSSSGGGGTVCSCNMVCTCNLI